MDFAGTMYSQAKARDVCHVASKEVRTPATHRHERGEYSGYSKYRLNS